VSQGTATSTHQAQLIGGGIAPTLFTTSVSAISIKECCLWPKILMF
jgi:hypothetical protein